MTLVKSNSTTTTNRQEITWEGGIFVLSAPRMNLLVEAGTIDVFGVPLDDDEPRGAWVSLGRLEAGDILTGPASGPFHSFVCRPQHDSSAVLISPDDDSLSADELLRGVQGALSRLTPPLSDALPPQDFDPVEAGNTVELKSGRPARPVDGTVWMKRLEGSLEGHGAAAWSYSTDDWFCVRRNDWVTATSGTSRLTVIDTERLLTEPNASAILAIHWTRFLYGVDRAAERTASRRRSAIDDSRHRDAIALGEIRDAADLIALESEGRTTHPSDRTGYLTAVLRAFHRDPSVREVPAQLIPALSKCQSFGELSGVGWIRLRMLRLEGNWWNESMGPLVGTWGRERTPVALEPNDGGYIAWFPQESEPVRVTGENHTKLRRTAFAPYPGISAGTSLRGLFGFGMKGARGDMVRLILTTVLVGAVGTLPPLLTGTVLGALAERGERNLIILAGLCLILTAVVGASLQLTQVLTLHRLRGHLGERTGTALWMHLLRLPVGFFEREAPGALATVVLGLRRAQEQISMAFSSLLPLAVVGIANTILLWWISTSLAFPVTCVLLVCLVLTAVPARRELKHRATAFEVEMELKALSYSLLQTMPKLRAAGAQMRALTRFAAVQRRQVEHLMKAQSENDKIATFAALLPTLSILTVVASGSLMHRTPPTQDLLSFLVALGIVTNSLAQVLKSFALVSPAVPQLSATYAILDELPETGPDQVQPGDLSGAVAFSNVSFRYRSDGPLVLDGINLDVAPGEFIGIVGPSGSGKSTLMRLILGFDRPTQGSVLLDGQDLSELDAAAVRRQFGIVMQDTDVMPGSIRENIISSGSFTDDDVWEAAEMAGIADDIRDMPMKLATRVSPGGEGLSGGQRQRLLIARTLISKPRMILFDEATSALDNPTQERITHAMRLINATRIVIAHRLTTVRHADRIVVVDKGRIVEQGTYDELLELNGVFAELARTHEQ